MSSKCRPGLACHRGVEREPVVRQPVVYIEVLNLGAPIHIVQCDSGDVSGVCFGCCAPGFGNFQEEGAHGHKVLALLSVKV